MITSCRISLKARKCSGSESVSVPSTSNNTALRLANDGRTRWNEADVEAGAAGVAANGKKQKALPL